MVDRRSIILARLAHAASVPGVGRQPDLLRNFRLDFQHVARATRSAMVKLARVRIWIPLVRVVVQFEEVVRRHAVGIQNELRRLDLSEVVLKLHEDEAVLLVVGRTDFISEPGGPEIALVTPSTMEAIFAPRVSHLDQFYAVAQSESTEDTVGVALNQTKFVRFLIIRSWSTSDDHIVLAVVMGQFCPNFLH